MKVAILSDIHFGNPNSFLKLSDENDKNKKNNNSKFDSFYAAVGSNNDYLILLGDIFDLSVASYEEVYDAAKDFFLEIKRKNIAKQIIYIPGNHDSDMWNILEHEINVMYQLNKGKLPTPFRMSIPGILDCRNNKCDLEMYNTSQNVFISKDSDPNKPNYSIFLNKITISEIKYENGERIPDEKTSEKEETIFKIVYPNLYLLLDKDTILLTHGHYFEKTWTAGTKLLDELDLKDTILAYCKDNIGCSDKEYTMTTLAGINQIVTQLLCTGVGQAFPFSKYVQALVNDTDGKVKAALIKKLENYLEIKIKEKIKIGYLSRIIAKKIIKIINEKINKPTSKNDDSKESKNIKSYLKIVQDEVNRVNNCKTKPQGLNINNITHIIFGHTHSPYNFKKNPKFGNQYDVANTGGWLGDGNKNPVVITIENGKIVYHEIN